MAEVLADFSRSVAVASILSLNSPVTRERYVRDMLEAAYGEQEFELERIDELLRDAKALPTWVRMRSDFFLGLGITAGYPAQAVRRCGTCHRSSNYPDATKCRGCGAALSPWPGRKKYLEHATRWRPLKTRRQCAAVRRTMERHGHITLQPSRRHYRINYRPTAEQQEALAKAMERASPREVGKELLGYYVMDLVLGMLPMMARYSIRSGKPLTAPFEHLDARRVLERFQEEAERWKANAIADGFVPGDGPPRLV